MYYILHYGLLVAIAFGVLTTIQAVLDIKKRGFTKDYIVTIWMCCVLYIVNHFHFYG